MNISSRSKVLENSLRKYFVDKKNFNQLTCVVKKKRNITLRKLEKFITKEASKNSYIYVKKDGTPFRVYSEYKNQLNAYTKRFFDPFCRYQRIFITDPATEEQFETTIGQLNFFKWLIENNLLDYIIDMVNGKQLHQGEFKFRLSF